MNAPRQLFNSNETYSPIKLSEVLSVLNGYMLREALPGQIGVSGRDLARFMNRFSQA